MMASQVLPPVLPHPLPPDPVVTFFSVPRRYVKSNMEIDSSIAQSPVKDGRASLISEYTNKDQPTRSFPVLRSAHRAKEIVIPPPAWSPSQNPKQKFSILREEEDEGEETEHQSPMEIRSPRSASAGSPEDTGHVCLCQPEPRIPRPRNAFILYRQHHQHAVVAAHPGLSNPNVSKIIGEQWNAEEPETRQLWQNLAQAEKDRHQELYPDYRYQPRQRSKTSSSPLNPSAQHTTVEKYKCRRCGGRTIKMPSTPFLEASNTPNLPPPIPSEGLTPTTKYLPMMNNLSLDSPIHRRAHGLSKLSNIQVPSLISTEADMNSPPTPGTKKRRFEYMPHNFRPTSGPCYSQYARPESLPPIQARCSPPNSATMPPPRTPRDAMRHSVAELHSTITNTHDHSPRHIEEVLSSLPYQHKIKLLGRITPQYEAPDHSSSPQARGAIIAIEGDDLAAIRKLTKWLSDRLIKDTEHVYNVRVAVPPRAADEHKQDLNFAQYLDLIKEWHDKSQEMISFITTPNGATGSAASSPNTMITDKSARSPPTPTKLQQRRDSASSPTASPQHASQPVIILPTFQLHASTTYAARIPITDAYSATDHWQWMATLWRGTVGPDLTIYIKTADAKDSKEIVVPKPELDDSIRCLTVYKKEAEEFAVSDLRRVGFEVTEFLGGLGEGGE